MLNEKDLAIVRAALQFLDEEFSPEAAEGFRHYLDNRGILAGASTTHIKATRAKLDNAEHYLAMKHLDQDELVSPRLIKLPTAEEANYQADQTVPVSVIVTGN